MTKPLASLSLDLDNKWSYLKIHGDPAWKTYPSFLDMVVPRFLGMLDDLRLRITVFVVGQDAALERNRPVLASVVAAGHEIGNHSFAHEPWLHLYSVEEVEAELTAAEEALEQALGVRPVGFRGPGYSLSPAVLASLARRGYEYDCSTLPTFLGPLARMYYFATARLESEDRAERKRLFGNWSEGLRPLQPYWWQWEGDASGETPGPQQLLEIPVTTMPLFRMPIHLSYLIFLRKFSRAAAWAYWRLAMRLCQLSGLGPSLLLHPLDFLGGNDDPDLSFFPAMQMPREEKIAFVRNVLVDYSGRFNVVPMCEHAAALAQHDGLKAHRLVFSPQASVPVRSAEVSRS